MMTNSTDCTVSGQFNSIVVIPTLNEAQHIESILDALSGASGDSEFQIWVVDGGSDDRTVDIVTRRMSIDENILLLHNPERTQAHALNLAAHEAQRQGGVEYLIRADAHAHYPPGWARRLIDTAEQRKADSVVIPMKTLGGGAMRDAASDLFNSWLGNGGSLHRRSGQGRFVEHGHHALFRLKAFLSAGGYDPAFVANEDAEFDIRLRRQGGRIFLEPRAMIGYVPRDSLRGVIRQFYRNGRYRLRTSRKHGVAPGLRQLVPTLLVSGLVACILAGAVIHPLLLIAPALYFCAVLVAASVIATQKSPQRALLIAVQAIAAHLSFGAGALRTLIERAPQARNQTAFDNSTSSNESRAADAAPLN